MLLVVLPGSVCGLAPARGGAEQHREAHAGAAQLWGRASEVGAELGCSTGKRISGG